MATLSKTPTTRPQAGDLSCEIVTSFARLDELRADWDRLWHSDPRAEVFQNYAWIRAFWSACGQDLELCSIVVRERNRTVGILPLASKTGTLQFLGSPRSDYNDIICEESCAPAVLERAMDELLHLPTPWKRCRLDNVSEASRLVRYLPSLPPRLQSHMQVFRSYPCPTITLKGSEVLKKSVRTHVRRQSRKLERLGHFKFRHMEGEPGIERHLELLFRQHMERQALRNEPSQFACTQSRQYFRAMALDLSLRPWLRFGVLELDSQPIAYHLGFQANGKYVWYKPSFAIDYCDYSPGELLLSEVVKAAAENGVREVDLTVGDEPYKLRFATDVRHNFLIFVARYPGHASERILFWQLRCKQWIKTKPALLHLTREARRCAQQTWQLLRLRVGREGLVRAALGTLTTFGRKAIWSADHLVLARIDRQQLQGEPDKAVEIVVQRCTLGDLVLASIPYADLIKHETFQMIRDQLKSGSELYLVQHGGKFVQFAMARESAEVQVGKGAQRQPLAIHGIAFVVHQLWTAPDACDRKRLFTQLFQTLGDVARERGRDLFVVLRREDLASADVSGAAVKLRLTRRTVFHKLSFESCAGRSD